MSRGSVAGSPGRSRQRTWRRSSLSFFESHYEVSDMNKMIRNTCLMLAAVFATATVAHHSAVQFDFAKQVSYTGKVKDFAAINPHMRLVVELKDAKGAAHDVRFEGHSTNNMYRAGYRKGMVKVGDTITVNAAPFRDGTE